MKKITILAVWGMLISLFLLESGCFLKQEEPETPPVYETHQGILKSLGGVKVSEKATHLLQKENEEILYLYSDFLDLNSPQYLAEEVEVTGIILKGEEEEKNLLAVEEIKLIPEEEKEENKEAWEIFQSGPFGFRINYQNTWQIKESKTQIAFTSPSEEGKTLDSIKIVLFSNPQNLSLEDWLRAANPETEIEFEKSEIGENQLSALKITYEGEQIVEYYVSRENYVYRISHYNTDLERFNEYRNLFYEMLYSFKTIPFSGETTVESLTEIVSGTKEEETTAEETKTISYQKIITAAQKKLADLSPEEPVLGGNWFALKFEFAEPNYVYVEYEDGHILRKMLLSYLETEEDFEFEVLAFFEPGTATDWNLISGADEAAKLAKEVITLGQSGQATLEIKVLEGYRYFESFPYKFKMQYPSGWYYAGGGGHYGFSPHPVTSTNEIISLDILEGSLEEQGVSGTELTLSGKKAVEVALGNQVKIYLEKDDFSYYVLTSPLEYQEILETMAGTTTEIK